MWTTTASATEIRCQDAGREQHAVFWSWREIDGNRCWFIRAGGVMPPKSAFMWAKEESIQQDTPATLEKTKTAQGIQMLRVNTVTSEEMSEVRAKWLNSAKINR